MTQQRTKTDRGEATTSNWKQTSVVLPAYNESGNIAPLIESLVSVFDSDELEEYRPYEVIIVDDGSRDGTFDVVSELTESHPQVVGIRLRRNFGQSAALAAGIDHARGDFIVTMDADGQNDPEDIPKLVEKLEEGYGCVSGWRKDRQDPLVKTVPSAIQTYLATFTGPDIHDFGCTLKAYRTGALREISLYGEDHRYIPAKLYKQGYDIAEIPVTHHPRTEGETKYGVGRLLKGFVDLLFHIFWNRFSTRPLHFLGGMGLAIMGVGGVIGAHAVILKFLFGVELLPRTPRLILTVAMVLFGFQLLMFGFLAEMIARLHYGDDQPYRIREVLGGTE